MATCPPFSGSHDVPNLNVIADRLRARSARTADKGAATVEYGLLVTLLAVVVIALLSVFGG
jgi:hypothetical protein